MEGEEDQIELSEETQRLAELGRNGTAPEPAPEPEKPTRPDNVPEKFWDAEKGEVNQEALLKSYLELEKGRGKPEGDPPADDADAADTDGDPDDDTGEKQDPPNEALTSAIAAAQEAYVASGGDLPQEHKDALVAAGIPAEALETYIAGVKATERALEASAHEAAGSPEAFAEATAWAAENWSPEEIAAFNASVGNPALVKTTVKGLMASFREANPGEGRLTNINNGPVTGEVYTDKSEFLKDLAAADAAGDKAARIKAVQKLERSKKAGTVKEVTPRTGPFRR